MKMIAAGMIGLLSYFLGIAHLGAQTPDQPGEQEDQSKERLIRKIKGDEDDDVMVRIIQRMDEVRRRLADLFDVGAQTQRIQQDILKELDLAIKQARQNMRRITVSGEQQGDKRKQGQASDATDAQDQTDASDQAHGQDAADGGDEIEAAGPGALREHKRQWGHLPPRDRDEILQGVNEDVQEKYREQIDRYYEALAQPEEE